MGTGDAGRQRKGGGEGDGQPEKVMIRGACDSRSMKNRHGRARAVPRVAGCPKSKQGGPL